MTSLPYSYVAKETKKSKAIKLFTKPFDINELVDTIISPDNEIDTIVPEAAV